MKELVKFIVENIVDDKDSVKVTVTEDNGINVIEVNVAEGDMGKVIGKNGKIAQALRSIVHSASVKHTGKYVLKIR